MKTPNISGLNNEQLNNLKSYVVLALTNWKENIYNQSKKEVDFNISYFSKYLQKINKELS